MRLKIIQQLVNVNIIYASQPAQIAKLRAKQAKKPDVKLNVARKSVFNYLFLGLVYFLIFGLLFSIYDFVHQPAFFVNMVALFSLMTISQGFMSFYNVFYESKDLQFLPALCLLRCRSHSRKEHLGHPDSSHGYPSLGQLFSDPPCAGRWL